MKNHGGCPSHIPFPRDNTENLSRGSPLKRNNRILSLVRIQQSFNSFQIILPCHIWVFPTISGRLHIFKIFSECGKIRKWFHFSFIAENTQDDWLVYSFSASVGKGVEGSLNICTEYSEKNIKSQGKGIEGRTARQRRNRLDYTELAIKIWKLTWKLAQIRLCLLVIKPQTISL